MVYSQNDSLNHYLKIAAENNPAVKAAFHTYEASLQKIPQMGAYEDPQLEMGFFLEPMDLVDGREIAQFQLMQMFPWFGTKKAARTEAQHMAKMEFEQFRERRDNLFLEVYTQWFKLCRLQQQWLNNRENKQLLLQLEELALRKFSSGGPSKAQEMSGRSALTGKQSATSMSSQSSGGGMSGMSSMNSGTNPTPSTAQNNMSAMNTMSASGGTLSDVLRIQLEIMEIENSAENLLSEIQAEKASFNALLNRPSGNDIHIPDTFKQIVFRLDMPSAGMQMVAQNPMLGMLQQEALAYQAQAKMTRKMSYPMFGIGLQYMLLGKKPLTGTEHGNAAMDNGMNGKDMIMPMVSITIPVYRNKYKAAQKENRLLQLANREKQTDTFNQLQAGMQQFKSRLDNASRNITLYRKQAELARNTCDLVIQEFSSGKSDLSDVLQVQRQLLDYQLKESEAIADYNTMVANIQKLLSSYENKE